MTLPSETGHTDAARKSDARKQVATWLTPEQIERVRDACLTDAFPNYLQERNETIVTLLADLGLRVSFTSIHSPGHDCA